MLYDNKRLVIIAHLPHYIMSGGTLAYEPYVREIVLWADLFKEVIIYTDIKKDQPNFATLLLPSNCIVKPIHLRSGSGVKNNLIRMLQLPYATLQILFVMIKCRYLHLRSPGLTTTIANMINLFLNKKTVIKWATNFPPDEALGFTSQLEASVLLKSRCNSRILVYRNYNHPNFIPFFPALFTEKELGEFYANVKKDKWQETGKKTIVCIGRFHPDKNIDVVIKAIALLKKDFETPPFKIELIGDGPIRNEIEKEISLLNLQDTILLKGSLPFKEVIKVLQASHFLIMPGKNEGWAKVINEALATNCIPIVVDSGNTSRVMEIMGYPGLLFDSSPESLAKKIIQATNLSKEEISQFLEKGNKANKEMTLEKFKNKVDKLIESL